MPSSRLPTASRRIRPPDQDLSLVQDNLAECTDRLLQFANGLLDGSTAEIISIGALTADTVTATTATATDVLATTVTASGAVTGGSFVSASGFKAIVGPHFYYNAAYPGGVIGTMMTLYDATAAVTLASMARFVCPYPGSVLALSARNITALGAATTQCTVYLQPAPQTGAAAPIGISTTIAAGSLYNYVAAAKDLYQFAAGDLLTSRVSYSVNPLAVQTMVSMVLEFDA